MMTRPTRTRPRAASPSRPLRLPGALLALVLLPASPNRPAPPRPGAPPMPDPPASPLLLAYFDDYLRDQDITSFRLRVESRYTEGTLARLVRASDPGVRRASVLALGLFGSFRVNAAVAGALKDDDQAVRNLAVNALW